MREDNKYAVCNWEKGPHQNPTLLALVENYEKRIFVVYMPPSLWCFVTAALIKTLCYCLLLPFSFCSSCLPPPPIQVRCKTPLSCFPFFRTVFIECIPDTVLYIVYTVVNKIGTVLPLMSLRTYLRIDI